MDEYFNIGKIAATHGVKGQLILEHSMGKNAPIANLKWIFLPMEGAKFLPYAIENCLRKNEHECFIKLEGIENKEAAKIFLRKEAWVSETDFRKLTSKSTPISWLGFMIMDGNNEVGTIQEVIEQPHQILCTVMLGENEAYIPVHENTLLKVDQKNKRLHLDIPEGLLEIYKNS